MRRYNQWACNVHGDPEDPTRCVAVVPDSTRRLSHQCSRKRGHGPDGLYCKQHAKKIKVEGREPTP